MTTQHVCMRIETTLQRRQQDECPQSQSTGVTVQYMEAAHTEVHHCRYSYIGMLKNIEIISQTFLSELAMSWS